MKIPRVLKIFAFVLALLTLQFTLSSKCGGDFTDPPDPTCADHAYDVTATINFDFEFIGGYQDIPHRQVAYEGFFHAHDIRSGYLYPEPNLSSTNTSYYGVVVISSPTCTAWGTKYYRIKTNNGSNKSIEVEIPDPTWGEDLRIEIIYYERIGEFYYMQGDDYTLEYYYSHVYNMNYQDTFTVDLWFNDYIWAYNLVDPYDPSGGGGGPVGAIFDELEL